MLVHEQRADHVLCDGIGEKGEEVFRLNFDRFRHGQLRPFIKTGHDRLDRWEIVLGLGQRHGVGRREELNRLRVHRARAARHLKALDVPRLQRAFFNMLFDPSCRDLNRFAGLNDLIDEALHFSFFGVEVRARRDHLRGVL